MTEPETPNFDWDGRLTAFIAALTGARQAKAAARVELNRRRAAGLARRHATKLERGRAATPPDTDGAA